MISQINDHDRRDLFALVAMHALLTNPKVVHEPSTEDVAIAAYGVADAMLEERTR